MQLKRKLDIPEELRDINLPKSGQTTLLSKKLRRHEWIYKNSTIVREAKVRKSIRESFKGSSYCPLKKRRKSENLLWIEERSRRVKFDRVNKRNKNPLLSKNYLDKRNSHVGFKGIFGKDFHEKKNAKKVGNIILKKKARFSTINLGISFNLLNQNQSIVTDRNRKMFSTHLSDDLKKELEIAQSKNH